MPSVVQTTQSRRIGFSETLALAGIPAAAYACAFVYEHAYASKYGFPIAFIEVRPTSILAVVGILVFTLLHAYLVLSVLPRKNWLAPVRLVAPLLTGFFLVWLLRTPGMFGSDRYVPWYLWLPVLVGTSLIVLLTLVQPIAKYSGDWTERWALAVEEHARAHPETAFFGVMDRVVEAGVDLSSWMRVYWILLLAVAIAHWSGRFLASRQTDFLVPARADGMVVLRVYGDRFVCASFDRTTRIVRREFRLIPITNDSLGPWKSERVGPLSVAPVFSK
jgi:hypothetical protein